MQMLVKVLFFCDCVLFFVIAVLVFVIAVLAKVHVDGGRGGCKKMVVVVMKQR